MSEPRFGWRPDLDAAEATPRVRWLPPGVHGGHASTLSNGNGHAHDPVPPLERDDYWSPAATEYRVVGPETRPRTVRRRPKRRRVGVPRGTVHLFVLAAIVTVVLGHGYWSQTQQVVHPGGVDTIGDLRQIPLPAGQSSTTTVASLTLATTASDTLTGYVSQLASAVVPDQLNVQTVTASDGQSIADIARKTGRDIDTLLWANGMTDPARPLADGTQVRVPPVDGMLHVVHDGDTLESIAARYQVNVSAITGYAPNNVQTTADLVPYRMIMVPGGTMPTRDRVVTYTVRQGDTLATIAQFFGLHPNTIIWANSLPDGNLILPGQRLAILPTDGVMVTVQPGDTVESLAEHFGVDPQAIRDYPFNGLGAGGHIRVGQQVMIPGGQPPAPPPPPPAPEPAPAPAPQVAEAAPPPPPPSAGASGHFIWPTNGVITQYFGPTSFWMEPAYAGYAHFHQGLDIANSMYTPIVAADAGTVIYSGWSNVGLGYCVAIDHGNGYVTWYGHMAEPPPVWVGQHVSQGQYIGPMGSTGASTGSHVHFVVLENGVYVDPLNYLN